MKIDISEKSGKVEVEVKVPSRTKSTDKIFECDYHAVIVALREKGFKDLVCTEGRHIFLSNAVSDGELSGTWVFQKKQADKPAPSKSAPRRKRASKKTTNPS